MGCLKILIINIFFFCLSIESVAREVEVNLFLKYIKFCFVLRIGILMIFDFKINCSYLVISKGFLKDFLVFFFIRFRWLECKREEE